MAAVMLVFGELAWGCRAEGGWTSLFLPAAPFQTTPAACEAAPSELRPGDAGLGMGAVSFTALALQLLLDFGFHLSRRTLCRNDSLGLLMPAPCSSGNCIT